MYQQAQSYHTMLRGVGAWLDTQNPRRFTVFEVLEGFIVIIDPDTSGPPSCNEKHLDREALAEQQRQIAARRSNFLKGLADRVVANWRLSDSTREDVLRAVGYELDDANAAGIIIDQVEDQLVLTYSYINPAEGYLWHKRAIFLGSEQIRTILEVAKSRRVPEPVKKQRIPFRR